MSLHVWRETIHIIQIMGNERYNTKTTEAFVQILKTLGVKRDFYKKMTNASLMWSYSCHFYKNPSFNAWW